MFEHHQTPLLSRQAFLGRVLRHTWIAGSVILGSLGVGILGYHALVGLGWLDSLLNASMILTGMGPVNPVTTDAGKIFASAYALFSGIVFLTSVAILFSPIFHRFLHRFHLDLEEDEEKK